MGLQNNLLKKKLIFDKKFVGCQISEETLCLSFDQLWNHNVHHVVKKAEK